MRINRRNKDVKNTLGRFHVWRGRIVPCFTPTAAFYRFSIHTNVVSNIFVQKIANQKRYKTIRDVLSEHYKNRSLSVIFIQPWRVPSPCS